MKIWTSAVVIGCLSMLSVGCHRGLMEGPYQGITVPEAALEQREAIVILDGPTSGRVAIDKQNFRHDTEGKLEVFADIRNRTNSDLSIDVQTVYKDESGIPVDTTAWSRMTLGPNETQTYKNISINDSPKRYTIRIRGGE
jgi:hypothetical protein